MVVAVTDRAQLHTGGTFRLVAAIIVGGAVLVIVINELVSMGAIAEPGQVEYVCGLCHVDWGRTAVTLLIIGGLTAAASWLFGGPKWPPEDEDE